MEVLISGTFQQDVDRRERLRDKGCFQCGGNRSAPLLSLSLSPPSSCSGPLSDHCCCDCSPQSAVYGLVCEGRAVSLAVEGKRD